MSAAATLIPLAQAPQPAVPRLFAPSRSAQSRFLEFFAARIRNPNTRRAYFRAVRDFGHWCEANGFLGLADIEPVHVSAYVELLGARLSKPSVKQNLAALRMLFDWLVIGQVIATNPASVVRGPSHSVRKGKTPVLSAEEARQLLDSIPASTVGGIRDRALIATMLFTFGRVGAVIGMRLADVYTQKKALWVRLLEKGGKRHEMPCHPVLVDAIKDYLRIASAGVPKTAYLFRALATKGPNAADSGLSDRALAQQDVLAMVRRRATAAGLETKITNHTFRATGITEYLRNDGRLEIAQRMANHESARTTGLYDRRSDELSLAEISRIRL